MDRKAVIILVLSVVVMLSWTQLVNRLYPPVPLPPAATNTVAGASNSAGTNIPLRGAANPAFSAAPVMNTPLIAPDVREDLVMLENASARYTFTSHGGGLKLVELKSYPEQVACGVNKGASTNRLATLNTRAPVPAFTLLGGAAVQGDGVFALTKTTTGVRAEKLLTNGLYLVKEFAPTTNYLVAVTMRLENRSGQPLPLPPQEWVVGTATPVDARDDGLLLGAYWYNGTKAQHVDAAWFANRTLGCFPGTPRTLYEAGLDDVAWAAVHNRFFTMIVIPQDHAPRVVSRHVDLPAPGAAELAANAKIIPKPVGFQTALVYPASVLAPGQTVERHYHVFAGPKEYNNLAKLGVRFGNNLDLVMNFGGFFGWFAKMLLLSMNKLHDLGLGYGLTIIAITVIIKVVFWPLTTASTRSMKRMAALQPEVKALQEKYKGDPMKLNQKTMELWREHKVSPMGGCLPMLLQLPVFFGFYTMLQSAIELRGASFFWACDLSSPDTLFVIPGVNFPVNLMPILMGATMLWQTSLTPPSPGMDPMQQKMMKYMPMMFIVFLYNSSAGLTLYWTCQNALSILQTKMTKAADEKTAPAPAGPPKKKK